MSTIITHIKPEKALRCQEQGISDSDASTLLSVKDTGAKNGDWLEFSQCRAE
ncbi:MAG: hypothetical protein ACYC7E_23485 [Armatimonadota bacterium]